MLSPLNDLLQVNKAWNWTAKCQQSFQRSKEMLLNSDVLVHYDMTKPLILATDASPYGVGAVLSHLVNGKERPIAFVSRTLTKTEKQYSQIDKEALGIIFGVKKFHQYVYGRQFTLVTDHRPLTALFGPNRPIPTLAAARMQRWALTLSAYSYTIQCRTSALNANADCFSRLPLNQGCEKSKPDVVEMFHIAMFEQLPLTAEQVGKETCNDEILSKVYAATMNGWTNEHSKDAELTPFYTRRLEISTHHGCLL